MDDIQVPSYYVVSRKLPQEEADAVMQALRITPCAAAIVSDLHDTGLGFALAPEVIRAASDGDALALAKSLSQEMKRALLVVGEADFLDAVYEDGRREAIAKQC